MKNYICFIFVLVLLQINTSAFSDDQFSYAHIVRERIDHNGIHFEPVETQSSSNDTYTYFSNFINFYKTNICEEPNNTDCLSKIKNAANNKNTPFHVLDTILEKDQFEFPDDSLQIPPPDYLLIFTHLWILLDQRAEYSIRCAAPSKSYQAVLSLSRLGILLAGAQQGSFTYASTLGTINDSIDRIETFLSLNWLTPSQLETFLNIYDSINLPQTLSRVGKADLISYINLIESIDFNHLPQAYISTFDDVTDFMIKRALLFTSPYSIAKDQIYLLENDFDNTIGFERKLLQTTPGYINLFENTAITMNRISKLRIRLAFELYKINNNTYPHTLNMLYSSILNKIPNNPITGNSYRYSLNGKDDYQLNDK